MKNIVQSSLTNTLIEKKREARSLLIDIQFIKYWLYENSRREDSYRWSQHLHDLHIYRCEYNELATEIRDIKKKIKEVNRKNYETF